MILLKGRICARYTHSVIIVEQVKHSVVFYHLKAHYGDPHLGCPASPGIHENWSVSWKLGFFKFLFVLEIFELFLDKNIKDL